MPVDMKKANAQPELQAIRKFEIVTADNPLLHMNTPLTHDIVADEGSLYPLHIEVQGLEYGIVHILLAFGGLIFTCCMQIDIRTHTSPF